MQLENETKVPESMAAHLVFLRQYQAADQGVRARVNTLRFNFRYNPTMSVYQRAGRILAGVLILYAALVATHKGEFWPLSIYPMFSQAGQPWTRALVREVTTDEPAVTWQPAVFSELPGESFALTEHGIFQNDLANYVSKTTDWTSTRVRGLEAMFRSANLDDRTLLIYKVRGALADDRTSVNVVATPVARYRAGSLLINPSLLRAGSIDEAARDLFLK